MKAVVATFNQEKALVGAFSVITNLRMELFQALEMNKFYHQQGDGGCWLEINSYLMTLSFCYSTESFGITVLTQSNSEFDFMPIYKCFQHFGSAQYIFLNWPPITSHKFDDSFTKIEACLLVVMQ